MDPAAERASIRGNASPLELLRFFEPVVCYTAGEHFYPLPVEAYVQACSLWEHHPNGGELLLVPQGELNLENLVASRSAEMATVRYLRFIEPLDLVKSTQLLADQVLKRRQSPRPFHPGIGRLARGGILPRLLDGLFSFSFLLRGRISNAIALAAQKDYRTIANQADQHLYYGRVIRQDGWTVLQYWYLYCFNDWRTSFHGVNDHESDWEMVTIYLYPQGGRLHPEWVAYASHDFRGNDLRRRWDDHQELTIVEGNHPLVFAGAGSHASYFRRGEYQAEVSLPMPDWLAGLAKVLNDFWTRNLGQPPMPPFHIPFVDFARGDGLRIGPGGHRPWTAVLIDESTSWVRRYQGLWGLYARDPISGENAPAGPMYNRDSTPRTSWYDPLTFAGLEEVPSPPRQIPLLRKNIATLRVRQDELAKMIPVDSADLQLMGSLWRGMRGNPHLARSAAAQEKLITEEAAELHALRREQADNAILIESLEEKLTRMRVGEREPPQAHIHRLTVPDDPASSLRFSRLATAWAAASLGLLMVATAVLIYFAPGYLWAGLGITLILFVLFESILRRSFVTAVARLTLLLAMLATIILFFHFWKWLIIAGLVILGVWLMYIRLRELAG